MLISSYLESVASTGRTVRAALSYLNFLQNRFYFSNSWNNLIAYFWIQMQQEKNSISQSLLGQNFFLFNYSIMSIAFNEKSIFAQFWVTTRMSQTWIYSSIEFSS